MKMPLRGLLLVVCILVVRSVPAADTVPTDIQQPGTQPQEINNLESPDKCDNCHGGYNSSVEPAYNWRGSMMAHAGRDPMVHTCGSGALLRGRAADGVPGRRRVVAAPAEHAGHAGDRCGVLHDHGAQDPQVKLFN